MKTVIEWCASCENDVEIPEETESLCPICGESILPCSACHGCTLPECPFN